jgi:phosphopantothenoylcysteine decarboxylase / phosphopantothenate---cysteine ligase
VRIVVTAGPTREPIDPVRFISNRSSGKMGYAIAEAARDDGHEVTLITGPTTIELPDDVDVVRINTSDDLFDAVHKHVRYCDVLVMCAAVSDYKPAKFATQKLEKQREGFALELIATRDILASLPSENRNYIVVGFAAQTHELEQNALRKLHAKNCDAIVANDVSRSDSGMESDDNEVTIFFPSGERRTIPRAPKIMVARELMKIIAELNQKSLTKKS